MQLNSVHYSNGFQRAQGEGGALRWSDFKQLICTAGKSFLLWVLCCFTGGMCIAGAYTVLGAQNFQPPKPESGWIVITLLKTHPSALQFSLEQFLSLPFHSDSKVQWDVFAKWDYFLPRGILDPVTNVMKCVSLSCWKQEARCSISVLFANIGWKEMGVGCLEHGFEV